MKTLEQDFDSWMNVVEQMRTMASPTPSSDPGTSSAATSSSASTASDSEPELPVINTKCGLCQETYTIPKVLSCFHTFCQPCLEKRGENVDKVVCPTCDSETLVPANGITGLVSDYAVSNVLESSALENASLNCTGCKSSDTNAVARCFDCANFLCAHCVMAHQFMHCFEGHRVLTLTELQNKEDGVRVEKALNCSRHKGEVLCLYCRSCKSPICKECSQYDHRGHEIEYLTSAVNREVEQYHQLLEQSKVKVNDLRGSAKNIEHSSNRLQIHYHKAQNEINETYNFYRSMLEERKAEALKEVETAYSTKKVGLSTCAQKMQDSIEQLYQSIEFIDKVTKHASNVESLMFKKLVDGKLQPLLMYNPDVNLSNTYEIEFVSNYQAIQVGVRNTFGYVRQSPDVNKVGVNGSGPGPIARPTTMTTSAFSSVSNITNGFGIAPATVETSLANYTNGYSNGMYSNGNLFDNTSNLLSANQKFPSSNSLTSTGIQSVSEVIMPSNKVNPYEKWSSGGFDVFSNSDIFSTSADPMIDLTSKLITANIYPPKSQIKRQKMIYHCKFGEFGVMEGQFTEPSGVAVNAQNDIIVADTNNHRIQIFDKEGRFKFQFGECGKRDGQLLYPNRVSVVKTSGDIVVTERSPTHQVQVYNQYGQFVRKFGASILQHPRGVTVDNKGRIIIVECKVMRVIIFDQMGNVLNKFSCSKHLEFPNGVVVNDREEIFISDNRAHCVKVFSYQGVYLRQIGGEGITNYPIGVGISSTGEVLIADNHNNFNLTVFTQDGQLINALESKVKHAQCFDVSLMDDGSIVLASKDYRLYIYRYAQIPAMSM